MSDQKTNLSKSNHAANIVWKDPTDCAVHCAAMSELLYVIADPSSVHRALSRSPPTPPAPQPVPLTSPVSAAAGGGVGTGGTWNSSLGASLCAGALVAGLTYSLLNKVIFHNPKAKKDRRLSPTGPQAAPAQKPQSQTPPIASPTAAASPTMRTPTIPLEESMGRFCKMEELGRGAFGVVFKGRHHRTGELVAIKEMAVADSEELRVEYNLLLGLKHENIVNVLAFETGLRHARLFLEWVAGGSLADMIKQFPMNEALVRNYTRQILQGLGFLHEHNIVHRDVKPKNILVDHRGVLKLTDFGLSRHIDSMRDRTRAAGTPVYMAPECLKGKFSVGSDIWAVGATVSEMLTQKLPWSHLAQHILSNQMALLYHIASFNGKPGHHPTIPRDASAECQDFMLKCFSPDPLRRGTCAELLEHPWFSVVEPAAQTDMSSTGRDAFEFQSIPTESIANSDDIAPVADPDSRSQEGSQNEGASSQRETAQNSADVNSMLIAGSPDQPGPIDPGLPEVSAAATA